VHAGCVEDGDAGQRMRHRLTGTRSMVCE
jgi:hypothetical protein